MIQSLSSEQILDSHSAYHFIQTVGSAPKPLVQSISQAGVKVPLLVHQLRGEYHLVDGFKRLAVLKQVAPDSSVPCVVLDPEIPASTVLKIILSAYYEEIRATVTSKGKFIQLALKHEIPRVLVIKNYFEELELEPHENIFRKMEAIIGLPAPVLQYCHEKKFSLRQCAHLTHHEKDVLTSVFSWKEKLSLSASIVEEVLDSIKACMTRSKISLDDFIRKNGISLILESDASPQQRTQELRDLLRSLRYPILSEINAKMLAVQSKMNLPSNTSLRWDPTLEHRRLDFHIQLKNPSEWSDTLNQLAGKTLPSQIQEIFEDL